LTYTTGYTTGEGKNRQRQADPRRAGTDLTGLMLEPTVVKAFQWIDTHVDRMVEEAVQICEIPAPTLEEAERAAYVKRRFAQLGLADVTIDGAGNVRGRRPGAGGGPGVAVGAHLDTVFPKWTNEHRLDEYIETGPIPTGIKNILLATVALAGKT